MAEEADVTMDGGEGAADKSVYYESQPFSQTQGYTQTQTQRHDPRPSQPDGGAAAPKTWALLLPVTLPDAPYPLPSFQLLRPEEGGKTSYTFGRADKGKYGNDLVLPIRKVSGQHARIYLEAAAPGQHLTTGFADGNVVIEDLSTNGTFVNGVKIGKGSRAVLATGDAIYFCPLNGDGEDIRYVFHATPAGYVAPTPDPEAAGGLYMCYECVSTISVALTTQRTRRDRQGLVRDSQAGDQPGGRHLGGDQDHQQGALHQSAQDVPHARARGRDPQGDPARAHHPVPRLL